MFDSTVLLGVVMFTVTVLALVGVILFARSKLVSAGNVTILINDDPDKSVEVPAGGKLLVRSHPRVSFWPAPVVVAVPVHSADVGSLKAAVAFGDGEGHFNRGEVNESWRLSCQVAASSQT